MHWLDPAYLPETTGKVIQFTINSHGELDGLVLDGERLIYFPPHMGQRVAKLVAVGDDVSIRGVKPRDAAMIAAVTIKGRHGTAVDEGLDSHGGRHGKPEKKGDDPMTAAGEVRLSLFGPRGELRGAVLADGTILRLGPKEADHIARLLVPGVLLNVRGTGIKNTYGRVIEVDEIADKKGLFVAVKKIRM
ncbi:MAG: hypothetical protein NTV97_35670 [Alphaproteobacteria bacterium]|nr:hypothetical protein [Alphaproteobacteria bacterium]